MANRQFQTPRALRKELVILAGRFVTTTGGTLSTTAFTSAKLAGFTLAKVGSEAGRYRVTLQDKYNELLGVVAVVEGAADAAYTTAAGVTPLIRNVDVSAATPILDIQFTRQDTGADAEVIDGAIIRITLILANSNV